MEPSVDTFATAGRLAGAYRRGELDPVAVTEAHLARAESIQPALNAFVLLDHAGARAAAEESARRWLQGAPRSPLDGVPVTIKDIVAMAPVPVRSGSRTTSEEPCRIDAPAVARLREAGAVLIGKTTTPEFGWKGITDSPLSGVTRNPWNTAHTPGGSSGGAGAALAAGVGAIAFGTDGGGSIRIPASFCGLVGIKPTFGRVPHAPMDSPFSLSVSGGPIARSVDDAARMLNELCRPDSRDPWALPYDGRDWTIGPELGVRGLRIAATCSFGGAEVFDEDIVVAWRAAVDALADRGARVELVDTVVAPLRPQFEAHWKAGFAHALRAIPQEHWNECDEGFLVLAKEGLDVSMAAFAEAAAARATLIASLAAFHERFDLLLTPTMPTVAPRADTVYHFSEYDRWSHATPYTVPFNLTGQPAGSMPVAVSGRGLPIGVQVVAARFREDLVLRGCRALEAAFPFAQPHPTLAAALASIGAAPGSAPTAG
ncbi:MAG: amidase [Acidimicrobiales bacterium]|nr:amidase [Acidimicrobiales bacterium]